LHGTLSYNVFCDKIPTGGLAVDKLKEPLHLPKPADRFEQSHGYGDKKPVIECRQA